MESEKLFKEVSEMVDERIGKSTWKDLAITLEKKYKGHQRREALIILGYKMAIAEMKGGLTGIINGLLSSQIKIDVGASVKSPKKKSFK